MDVVAVFGASVSLPGDALYEQGVRCGRLLAEAGFGVATGGYDGVMEAVSLGAKEADAEVIGVTAPSVFPDRAGGNAHLTQETRARSLLERIHELAVTSVAAIALPGSLGTARNGASSLSLTAVPLVSPVAVATAVFRNGPGSPPGSNRSVKPTDAVLPTANVFAPDSNMISVSPSKPGFTVRPGAAMFSTAIN